MDDRVIVRVIVPDEDAPCEHVVVRVIVLDCVALGEMRWLPVALIDGVRVPLRVAP